MTQHDDDDNEKKSRRDFLKASAAVATAIASVEEEACAPLLRHVRPVNQPPEPHKVIIIGSGFGAMVAATTLAGLPNVNSVLMLERGVFFTSPERPTPPFFADPPPPNWPYWKTNQVQYWPTPDNDEGLRQSFLKLVRLHRGGDYFANPGQVPLYNYSRFDHVDVLTANGVGGGSLIYSNVSLEPFRTGAATDCPVMHGWPVKLATSDYDKARAWMAKFRSVPNAVVTTAPLDDTLKKAITHLESVGGVDYSYLYLPRSRALKRAATRLKASTTIVGDWEPLPLQVFEHGGTPAGELAGQRFCERQGRCFLGCLPGARHTLNKLLFADTKLQSLVAAKKLTVRPMSNVRHVAKAPNGEWDVTYYDVVTGDEYVARAPVVIVAAGVLGTVEILLRSRDRGLPLSDRLGHGFSTNGDFSGFVVDIPKVLKTANATKLADNRVFPTKGPINTSHVTFQVGGGRLVNVEDAGIPAMFAEGTKRILKSTTKSGFSFFEFIAQLFSRTTERQTEAEMIEDTFWFNCMGDDGDPVKPFRDVGGKFTFDHDRLSLDYDPSKHPVFQETEKLLMQFADAMDEPNKLDTSKKARYVKFPLWNGLLGSPKLAVTHPLGGCIMGNAAEEGAVSTDGRLFSGKTGTAAHKGLFVMDGSVSPGPVAVNPSLTIVALALRIVEAAKTDL